MPASDQRVDPDEKHQFVARVLVFLTRGKEVLLIRWKPEKGAWSNLYNGLGGRVERGETALQAAQREVHEECGIQVDNLWLCAILVIDVGNSELGKLVFIFRGETKANPVSSAEGKVEWVRRINVSAANAVEDLPILLPRLLDMKRGDPPIWGFYEYDKAGKLIIRFED